MSCTHASLIDFNYINNKNPQKNIDSKQIMLKHLNHRSKAQNTKINLQKKSKARDTHVLTASSFDLPPFMTKI